LLPGFFRSDSFSSVNGGKEEMSHAAGEVGSGGEIFDFFAFFDHVRDNNCEKPSSIAYGKPHHAKI
jgi:hypothetical protein